MNWTVTTPLLLLALAAAALGWSRRGVRRTTAWTRSARILGGAFDDQRKSVAYAFGRAPWQATTGPESTCALLVHAEGHAPPFWIVETHLPQAGEHRAGAGEQVCDVTVAVVRVGVHTGPKLLPVAAAPGHTACTNGAFLFVWEEAPGRTTGRKQKPARLPGLLRQALLTAAPLQAMHAAAAILGSRLPQPLQRRPTAGSEPTTSA